MSSTGGCQLHEHTQHAYRLLSAKAAWSSDWDVKLTYLPTYVEITRYFAKLKEGTLHCCPFALYNATPAPAPARKPQKGRRPRRAEEEVKKKEEVKKEKEAC